MSNLSIEDILIILVVLVLCCIILSQWQAIKCLLCKAITIISSSISNSSAPPPINRIEWQFQDYSIPQNSSPQFQGSDLELSIINSLPIYQFKKNESQEKTANVDCPICLGEYEEGEWLKLLPSCKHGFHVSCIDKWFQLHSSCPLCRSRVQVANKECSVSFRTWLEILGMDDSTPERSAHFQSHSL
jgi:hypothetical protein